VLFLCPFPSLLVSDAGIEPAISWCAVKQSLVLPPFPSFDFITTDYTNDQPTNDVGDLEDPENGGKTLNFEPILQ